MPDRNIHTPLARFRLNGYPLPNRHSLLARTRLPVSRSHLSRDASLGWKPYREIALAERISERRRLRAAETRARAREEKTLSKRGPPAGWVPSTQTGDIEVSDITQVVSTSTTEETRARMLMSWAEKELERSRKRRAEDITRFSREIPIEEPTVVNLPVLYGGEVTRSTSNTIPVFPRRRETIHWNYPNYNDGYDIPTLNLPPALEGKFATATVTSGDRFPRAQTNNEEAEARSIPYSYRHPPSEPVSPKSKPVASPLTCTSASAETTSDYPTTDSDQRPPNSVDPSELITPPTTVSQPTSGVPSRAGSQRFQKFRSALKSAFPRVPWNSSSRKSKGTATSNSTAESSIVTGSSWKKQGVRVPPWKSTKNNTPSAAPASEPFNQVAELALLSNKTTTFERVQSSVPSPQPPPVEEEKLTRTEREYQEVLEALQQLKREMMLERSERRRSRSRGRRMERGRRNSSARQSKETVRWWLGDVS